ncbi:hypothetical protein SASPL_136116 [Salvia splendens]|uniref:Uncharacterized protein n=1 Tax=Salvia splendens TaxID=180675 RepID=A0A8X8WZZ3_SALSN|nr:uncharacterized protein LOC121761345 [Salvia splendens]KAG6403882.1 hypothetical protein SASPL_136116 [Salvia splendens]
MSGGGGGGGLSNLGISLVIIFTIALIAIFAQVFYIIWRRLAFRRRTSAGGDGISRYSSSESTPSKELLYFFCVRPQLDLDRTSISGGVDGRNSNRESDVEVIDIDLLKIQGVFGPPRFLFTIKEEEREGTESLPAEDEATEIVGDEKRGGVSLEECFRSEEETAVVVEVKTDDCSRDDDATPFSTPCASPLYFTPTASPVHAVVNGRSTGIATTVAV